MYKGLIKPYVVLEAYNTFNKSLIDALLMFIPRTVAFSTTRHFFPNQKCKEQLEAKPRPDHDVLHCWGFHPGVEDKSTSYDRTVVVTVVSAATQMTTVYSEHWWGHLPASPVFAETVNHAGKRDLLSADRRHRQENVLRQVLTSSCPWKQKGALMWGGGAS